MTPEEMKNLEEVAEKCFKVSRTEDGGWYVEVNNYHMCVTVTDATHTHNEDVTKKYLLQDLVGMFETVLSIALRNAGFHNKTEVPNV